MKDATAGKSFLEDIKHEVSILIKIIYVIVVMIITFVMVFAFIADFHKKRLNTLSSRVTELETKMHQQESLTREALGVDHKERIQAVYNINY